MRSTINSEQRGWNIVLGVLSLIAAVLPLASPGVAVGTIALLAGIMLIVRGCWSSGSRPACGASTTSPAKETPR